MILKQDMMACNGSCRDERHAVCLKRVVCHFRWSGLVTVTSSRYVSLLLKRTPKYQCQMKNNHFCTLTAPNIKCQIKLEDFI